MKKFIVILLALLLSPVLNIVIANDLAELCQNIPGVTSVEIDQSMLNRAVFPSNDSPIPLDRLADRLDKVQIISITRNGPSRDKVMEVTTKYLESEPQFQRAMRTKDDTTFLMLYSRSLGGNKNEFLLMVEDNSDLTIIVLSGNVTMQDIGAFTSF